mmetsp:Transcript_62745/g.172333  ORF Transcript_62745/g.172333 Transcript_62745/m.172333 type:complete len:246 (+) Transcript_62745:81-818(+)
MRAARASASGGVCAATWHRRVEARRGDKLLEPLLDDPEQLLVLVRRHWKASSPPSIHPRLLSLFSFVVHADLFLVAIGLLANLPPGQPPGTQGDDQLGVFLGERTALAEVPVVDGLRERRVEPGRHVVANELLVDLPDQLRPEALGQNGLLGDLSLADLVQVRHELWRFGRQARGLEALAQHALHELLLGERILAPLCQPACRPVIVDEFPAILVDCVEPRLVNPESLRFELTVLVHGWRHHVAT